MTKKKSSSDGTIKLKIRGDKELAENIVEISENHVKQHQAENPRKTNSKRWKSEIGAGAAGLGAARKLVSFGHDHRNSKWFSCNF